MSNIYIQEPPTEGKVLLETTVGDIDIELWSRECPKACRNFIQLCMEGYYDRTIFHRLVKDFIVQGGDPTGTGTGGNSIWGKPFKDEFHSRLRFARRGLVAMANAGRDDNGSQFFFTLGQTPELQSKHTLFGKVGGNTIYNMIKLGEGEVDEDDKPLYPHKILRTKILNNPFEDIVPRESIKSLSKEERKAKKNKSTAVATKNYSLLSFGEEAEEEEEEVVNLNRQFSAKGKSSHDLLIHDPKLSAELAVDPSTVEIDSKAQSQTKEGTPSSDEEMHKEDETPDIQEQLNAVKEKLKKKTEATSSKLRKIEPKKTNDKNKITAGASDDEEYYLGKADKLADLQRLETIRKEYRLLKRSMKQEKETADESKAEEQRLAAERDTQLAKDNTVIQAYFDEHKVYKEKKSTVKKGDDRETQTLALLQKFKSKIEAAKETYAEEDLIPKRRKTENDEGDGDSGILDEKVAKEGEEEVVDPSDISWLARSLHNVVSETVLAKDANKKSDDWYEIYDPKNPLNRRRREETKRAEGEKWKKLKPTD